MIGVLTWLALYVAAGLVGFYALYIAARIVARTLRGVFRRVEYGATVLVEEASDALAGLILLGLELALYWIVIGMRLVFWPLRFVLRKAKRKMDNDRRWSGPPPSNPVKEAIEILGLGQNFSAADVKTRHKELIKRLHTDAGGSDWLASRINWARDVLLEVA
jgi:hypothetical protein